MAKKVEYSPADQEALIDTEAGQSVLNAAEGVVFDEFDRIAERVNLPVQERYEEFDLRRLGAEARWGEPHNAAWYIGLIAIY